MTSRTNPSIRPMFPKVAALVAVTTALAAVTALATAPLRQSELPPPDLHTMIDALPIVWPALRGESGETYVRTERIRRGDTLAALLDRLDATDPAFQQFVESDPLARRVLQLHAGRTVHADIDSAGRVQSLQYRYDSLDPESKQQAQRLTIERADDGFRTSEAPVPIERQLMARSVVIQNSLFGAFDAAGIPDSVASKVADVLQDKVDFTRDLRRGDQLRVLYETIREADSLDPPMIGRVIAIEFDNHRTRHEAVWFDRSDGKGGYYSFDGQSLKRSFLRRPVEFTRISSRFQSARMHPILGYARKHEGTDFAAPLGTKVRSAGDGVVKFVGRQRGYGKVIILQHGNDVTTLYAHLHGFAGGLVKGARVAQGDVIGFVGATGMATGPHLHYEFMVKGRNVDPLKAVLPTAEPLDRAEMRQFRAQAEAAREQLARTEGIHLARFE